MLESKLFSVFFSAMFCSLSGEGDSRSRDNCGCHTTKRDLERRRHSSSDWHGGALQHTGLPHTSLLSLIHTHRHIWDEQKFGCPFF